MISKILAKNGLAKQWERTMQNPKLKMTVASLGKFKNTLELAAQIKDF